MVGAVVSREDIGKGSSEHVIRWLCVKSSETLLCDWGKFGEGRERRLRTCIKMAACWTHGLTTDGYNFLSEEDKSVNKISSRKRWVKQ